MTPPPQASSPQPPETSVGGRAWFVAATLVLVVAVGASAWWFLFGGSELAKPDPEPKPVPAAGKAYVPAEHLDGASARLAASSDGKRVLDLDVRDVKDGERLVVRRRETAKAATSILLFLSVGDPATAKGDPGLLEAVTASTGPAGATHLRVELDGAVDRVTVIDLRFGAWQGIEVVREGAPPPPR